MEATKRDVILVGGGHASIPLIKQAKKWSEQGISVMLITASQYLYYSGMVPEYLGGVYRREQVRIDLQALCLAHNIEFRKAQVVGLEPEHRRLTTAKGDRYVCRLTVFDIGSRNPNLPGMENISPTKPLHKIERLEKFTENHLLNPTESKKQHLVIVGGGAAGVEIALNISARVKAYQRHTSLKLTLIEEQDRLLSRFPASAGEYVSDWLQKRGVDVRIKRKTTRIDKDQLVLDDDHTLPYDFGLWATGPTGQPIFAEAGLECDQKQFLWIEDTLRHAEYPWLFAAGDCVRIRQLPDLEKLGIHAVKQGAQLLHNVDAAVQQMVEGNHPKDAELESFKPYPVAPVIISTGGKKAIWITSRTWFSGKSFLRLKHWLDARWIEDYQYPIDQKIALSEKLHTRYALKQ